MRALIFEPQFVGHNLVYVRHIVQALAPLGIETILLTSRQAAESEEFSKHLAQVGDLFSLWVSDRFAKSNKGPGVRVNGPSGLASSMQTILDGLRSTKPDHFYLPFGNPLAHALGLPNPISKLLLKQRTESEIVLLFGKYAYKKHGLGSRIKQELALRLLAAGPWTRIHHIVPHAIDVMQAHRSRISKIAHLLADPIDPPIAMSKDQARGMLQLDPLPPLVSLIGLIDQRKGVGDLLAAASLIATKTPLKILLAGKHSSEARELLAGKYQNLVHQGRVISIDRHLSTTEMWAACAASDLITTPYPEHRYSASILIRAAAVGVPVLANRIGWMEDVTHRYGLGWSCNTRDPANFASTMLEIIPQTEAYKPSETSRHFVDFHSLDNFQSQITRRIRERLNAAESATS